jgi:chromosome segregation protein
LSQEIIGLEAELERLRALQQAREKDRVALDHDMRKLGDDLARRTRGFRWRVWSWNGCGAMPKNRPSSARRTAPRSRRKTTAGAAGSGARSRAAGTGELEGQAATIGEDHAATRAELAGLEERHRGERSAMGRLEQQFRETSARRIRHRARNRAAGRAARPPAGRQYRAGREATCWPGKSPRRRRASRDGSQEAAMREALRAGEEDLKTLRAAGAGGPREALADGSGPGAQAGRVEVPGRDQPQGTELPGGGTGVADDPVPDGEAIAEAERPATKCATASKRWGR